MNQAISEYLSEVQRELSTGDAKEHAYRPAFKRLTEALVKDIQAINDPAYTGGNAPDFLFKKDGVPIAYAECKDLTVEVTDKDTVAQAERYVEAFGKILLTNYLDFRILDESGEVTRIAIATKSGSKIEPIENNFDRFENLIKDYITPSEQTIRSAKKLAEIMAAKGRLLRDNSLAALKENKESDIYSQYRAFKEVLIRDLSEEEFADMYAQTLVYGLFVARYFDPSLKDFSRHEAQDLLPSTNPLLKKFFGHVAGTEFDHKVAWMVDSLIEAYKSTDVRELMHKEFEKKQKDPVLHFYETFLSEYDKGLRKSRGVYYTPEPIVSFIVRSVDLLLKNKFNLAKGLADTTKIEHEFRVQGSDGRRKDKSKKVKESIHKVQILDPAVGTGTFLNEVINIIYKSFAGQEGRWSGYVEQELLPRLHGFELMMASYTMAHLKLGVTLKELGYEGEKERLSVWLTNSLEESVHEVPNLFMSQWLTQESNEAARVKSDMPIMIVTGNPPYSVRSVNKNDYIQDLIADYKEGLNEKKINLDDDYIKFLRFSQNAIEKTGYGMVAMITNNSFIDGVTHRQMRRHLKGVFDEIYIIDLHGDSKRDDGENEENVFSEIQQGVSINILIKYSNESSEAVIKHFDLPGKRKEKFDFLNSNNIESLDWTEVASKEPYHYFVPKNFEGQDDYENGFSIKSLFKERSTGIETQNDSYLVSSDKETLLRNIRALINDEKSKAHGRLSDKDIDQERVVSFLHKTFDFRYTYLDSRVLGRSRLPFMENMNKDNVALLGSRQFTVKEEPGVLVCNSPAGHKSFSANDKTIIFPLYVYHEDGSKVSNLDEEISIKFKTLVGDVNPEDIFNYVYASLSSETYRKKYKQMLRIDFPRVPYPQDKDTFWELSELGNDLKRIHLLDQEVLNNSSVTFPEGGNNEVKKGFPKFKDDKVYINEAQYFGNVTKDVWNYKIGGYIPASKWLKDRKEQMLSDADIEKYQNIIVAISKTLELIPKIDLKMKV